LRKHQKSTSGFLSGALKRDQPNLTMGSLVRIFLGRTSFESSQQQSATILMYLGIQFIWSHCELERIAEQKQLKKRGSRGWGDVVFMELSYQSWHRGGDRRGDFLG